MEHKLLSETLQEIENDIVELKLFVSFDVEGVFQYKKTPTDLNHSVKMNSFSMMINHFKFMGTSQVIHFQRIF